jgi:hypothetical protein
METTGTWWCLAAGKKCIPENIKLILHQAGKRVK